MKNILFLLSLLAGLNLSAQKEQGSLDSTFGSNGAAINKFKSTNDGIALQHTGKIIVCGLIDEPISGSKLARYNTDGSLDSSFGKNGYAILSYDYNPGEFSAVSILDDDKMIAAGLGTDIFIAKFTADGKLDSTFGKNGYVQNDFGFYESIFAMQIQSDGKIVVAGEHSHNINNDTGIVVRYLANGALDKDFGNNGQVVLREASRLFSLLIEKNNKIVVGGIANNTDEEFYVGRLNENGSYDESFNKMGYVYTRFTKDHRDELHSLALQSDGKILAAGISNIYFLSQDMGVARYNMDGSFDSSFGVNGLQSISVPNNTAEASTVLTQNNGQIILSGGVFNNDPLSGDVMLARLNTNGSLDSSFGENGISITNLSKGSDGESGAILQADGKIVVAGTSSFDNKNYDNVARFNNDGLTKKQQIISKIRRWIYHHNGIMWNSNSNVNNYLVQRSYDGIHFSSLYRINAGNTSNYTYADPSPLSGSNYYRLQTTSVNGAVNYSNVLAVTADEASITISPNPAKNNLHIEGLSSNTKLTVVDFTGNIKLQTQATSGSYNLNIASLKTGNYLLKIETNGVFITKKFLKE